MTDRNRIKPRRLYTSGYVPVVTGSTPDLDRNEIAINWADGKIFTRDDNDQLVTLTLGGGGGGGSANIVEAATVSAFPATGAAGTLYIATDASRVFRWDASGVYVELGTAGGGGGGTGELPVASSSTLGGVKVGSGLTITDGVLSADNTLATLFVPPAPTSLTATAGNAQVSLAWAAPTVLSQTPITDYVVQYSSNSGSTWTTFSDGTSTATSATITGLTNGTAYTFRVAAVNGAGQGAWSSTASTSPAVDTFLGSVVTYLRMNGASGSQTFTDSSPSPKTASAINGTQVSTGVKKYGTGSATSFSYGGIAIANATPNFSGDFTIEMWAYFNPCTADCNGYPYKPNMCLFRTETSGGSQYMISEASHTQLQIGQFQFPVPSVSEWHHIAIAKQGTTIRAYVDGVESGNSLNYGPQYLPASVDNVMYVGGFGSWRWFDGYIDDFRVTNACRYPNGTTFTPPTE